MAKMDTDEDIFDQFERNERARAAATAHSNTSPDNWTVPSGPSVSMPIPAPPANEDIFDQFQRAPMGRPPPPVLTASQQFWETPLGLGIRANFYGDEMARNQLNVLNSVGRRYPLAEASSEYAFPEGMDVAPGVTLGGAAAGPVLGAAAGGLGAGGSAALGLAGRGLSMGRRAYVSALKKYPIPTALVTTHILDNYMPGWLRTLYHIVAPHGE